MKSKNIYIYYALCFRKRNRAEIQEEERDPFENFVYVETVNHNQEEKVCEREFNLGEENEKESQKYSDGFGEKGSVVCPVALKSLQFN